ncbi:MAG: peptide ABC transporter substrate-binding protein [Rhodospirillaceae bacterium]|nr:peptide ABC transporter substrate-binding protein [Rhodospirillaceae bacterium]
MRFYRVVAVLVAAVGLLSAAPLVQAEAKMVFHRGNAAEPDTLDPHLASSAWENHIIGDLFLGLTTEDAQAHPIPGIAESWTTSPDGLTWTFKLRKGMAWSDGVPIKASDAVFGLRRVMDPKTASKYASMLYIIDNAEDVNAGKKPLTALGVRALDDYTVELKLTQPAPFLPGLLTHYTSFPLPEHVVTKFGKEWTKPGNMVSSGAYMLAEWIANDYVKIVKNPKFYDAAKVAIDEVYFYPTEDERAALTRFRAGELDANITNRGFPVDQIPWLKANMPGQGRIHTYLANEYIVANTRRKPFDDPRVRRALSLALKREIYAEKVYRDGRVPAYSFVPPGIDNYESNFKPRMDFADWPEAKRIAEAKRLLAEAGFGPGNPLKFDFKAMTGYDARRAAAAITTMWREVGIDTKPLANEPKTHYNVIQAFDFDVAWAAWVGDYNDPQTFLYLMEGNAGAFNYAGYKNADYDALMSQAKQTLDLKKRADILAQAEQKGLNDTATIPLTFTTTKNLVGPQLKGYVDNISNWHRTRFMRIER